MPSPPSNMRPEPSGRGRFFSLSLSLFDLCLFCYVLFWDTADGSSGLGALPRHFFLLQKIESKKA
jgi:hypothetical protein